MLITSGVDIAIQDDFSVYLGNISPDIPRKEVVAKLVLLFRSLGIKVEAKNVQVNRRGKRPVYCFVQTRNEYEQQTAIGSLHNSDKFHIAVKGKKLSVNKKIPKKAKTAKHSPKLASDKLLSLKQKSVQPLESVASCSGKSELDILLVKEDDFDKISEENDDGPLPVPQAITSAPFQETHYYYVGQCLSNENRLTEYKSGGGSYLKKHMKNHVAKYVCAFLNSEGGKLLIGVSNDCFVRGIPCDGRQEDRVRLLIDETIKCFNPPVFPDRYSVRFVPVFIKNNDNLEPSENNLKVIEISINGAKKQPNVLYENNKGQVFIRRDGSVQGPLKAGQILEWCRLHFVDKQSGSKERLEKEVALVKDECRRKQDEIDMNIKLVSELSKQKDFVEGQHKLKEEQFHIREMQLQAELESVKRVKNKKSSVCMII